MKRMNQFQLKTVIHFMDMNIIAVVLVLTEHVAKKEMSI